MKIGIINDNYTLGGVQRVSIEIAEGLAELNKYEINLVNFMGSGEVFYPISDKVRIISNSMLRTPFENITFKVDMARYKFFRWQMKYSKQFKRQLNKMIQIIEENKFECLILCQGELTSLIPNLKKKFPYIKFIAWQHSSYEVYVEKYYVSFLDEYLEGLKFADAIVCLTHYDKKLFEKHNSNVHCIYNPLTLQTNKVSDLDNPNIIFTGRLSIETKGLDFIVKLAEKAPANWTFKIAGDGPDKQRFEQLLLEKGVSEKIKCLGALKGDELINHYLDGAVFLLPSRWEGFGLVLTEAMKCGLPIISFDNFGPREVLGEGEYGVLIEKYNIDLLYSEIEKLMSSKELRKDYQEKSLERVKSFSIDMIIPQWEEIITNFK